MFEQNKRNNSESRKYRPTPIIGKIRIKMTQGIFIEEVLSDAYNPKTKIPLKILVNKFMTSAYSFKRVTIVIKKSLPEECRLWKNTAVLPHFLFLLCPLKYLVSYIFHLPTCSVFSLNFVEHTNFVFYSLHFITPDWISLVRMSSYSEII